MMEAFEQVMSLSSLNDFTLSLRSTGNLHSSGYYAAYSGNSLPTFRYILSVQYSRIKKPENWTDRISRNVDRGLQLYSAK